LSSVSLDTTKGVVTCNSGLIRLATYFFLPDQVERLRVTMRDVPHIYPGGQCSLSPLTYVFLESFSGHPRSSLARFSPRMGLALLTGRPAAVLLGGENFQFLPYARGLANTTE